MTEQLSLLDVRSDPHRGGETQIEAAIKIRPYTNRLEQMVLDALETYGPLTNDELVNRTGISLQTICARVWTLRTKLGLVKDSGFRRPSRSGRQAIVWTRTNPSERR